MKTPKLLRLLAVAVPVVALGALAISRKGPGTQVPVAEPHTTPWLEGGQIHYPESFAERERLTLGQATEGVLTPTVQVTGVVTTDGRRVATIGGRIAGRLRTVTKVAGDPVEAGEVVAELESLALGQAQAEVLKVRAREVVAKIDAERERRLADAHVTSEREAQMAAANAEALAAERIAAEKAVEALGGTTGGEMGVLKLRSPLRGRVIEAHVRRGQSVEPSDTLFVVADLSRVWVEWLVFEKDLPSVGVGDEVEVHVPSVSGESWKGTITHVSETIDAQKRAASVRVELENQGLLRPGLSVTGIIHTAKPRERRLLVPREAVTRVDGRTTVFLSRGPGTVEPRVVEIGPEDSTHISILSGVEPGAQVVVKGVLALKAEVFR